MPFTGVDAQEIYFVERGASTGTPRGVPLVFIHGAGSSHLIWGAQVRALSDTSRVLALDLPGHGRSQPPGRDSIEAYARVVASFLNGLALERSIVVGHSMGGAIAQMLALAYPDRVAALACMATAARLRVNPAFLQGFQNDFDKTVDRIMPYYFGAHADARLIVKSAALLRASGQPVVLGDFSACDAFDTSERLAGIRMPTLVLCGREDKMTPPASAEFLAAKIPNAKLILIQGAGHHVMIEKPAPVNRALADFIRTVS